MTRLRDIKQQIEERFHDKWTSLSIQFHFKSIASHVLGFDFAETNFHLNDTVSEEDNSHINTIIQELETYKPLQYILGVTFFMDCQIRCTPVALIPRPETEELVELVLKNMNLLNQPKVLDLCTGTGCIAIALQKRVSDAMVIGIDNNEEVILLANQNNDLNETNVKFNRVDVLEAEDMITYLDESYDIWVSNPPYIPNKEMRIMEKNVLDYEPAEALFVSDDDPLIFYRSIVENAFRGLKSGGFLFLEIHEDFGQETIDLLRLDKFKNIQLHPDLQGKNRMISAMKM